MSALVEANDDNVSLDVHHLASTISVPYEDPGDLTARAASATQALIGSLFELPATRSSVGPIAKLPPATTALPREKPCPEKKAETKWDKFAKEKGIQKKKKGRMEWDDERDKWAPTWGYDRAGSALDDAPIVEVKAGGDIMADPWEAKRAAKKERADGRAEGLPVDMARKTHKGAKGVAGALAASRRRRSATDAMLDGEQARPSGEAKGRKRKFKAVAGPAGADADRGMAVMRDLEAPRAQKPKKGAKEVMDTHDGELPNGQSFKRKKGRAGAGKMKKVTKARGK
ncbi:hypothetical protein JL722_91 [Aureococcus anophagefferens]|nr:hypothetical protein JL722_91 [Aureococcus anophagefferens]